MSEVDAYLDELFDRLAGSGAAGRRMLVETEDHLRSAVADGTARGLSAEEAEHQAVTRFGAPARITRQLRRADRARSVSSALSGMWLLAGLGLMALGLSYLINALRVARTWPNPCPDEPGGLPSVMISCAGEDPRPHVTIAIVAVLTAALVLIGRHLAMRFAGLVPVSRRFPLVAAVLFAIGGLAVFAVGRSGGALPYLIVYTGPGLHTIVSGVAALTSVSLALAGVVRARRPRYLQYARSQGGSGAHRGGTS